MATRYYPAPKAPGVIYHGNLNGDWGPLGCFGSGVGPVQATWELERTKANAGNTQGWVFRTNQQPYDFFCARFITPPLQAQTLVGTLNLCFNLLASWNTLLTITADSIVRYKVHAYIAQGQTTTVRTVLINNYIDSVNFPFPTNTWMSLSPSQPVGGEVINGDVIIIEFGFYVLSSPAPPPTYPPSDMTVLNFRGTGATSGDPDAVAGETDLARAPWIEFSADLVEQAVVSPPANDACADALEFSTFPYTSPFINCTQSTDADRAIWYKFTAPLSGTLFLTTHGSNYRNQVSVFEGGCGVLNPTFIVETSVAFSLHRAHSYTVIDAVAGTEYLVRVRNQTSNFNSPNSGGLARLNVFYRQPPLENDLYLPNGTIFALREGQYVNMSNDFFSSNPSGVAIDYTGRPMTGFDASINTNHRLLVAMQGTDLVEVLDLPTLSLGGPEIDFFANPWDFLPIRVNPAQLYITRAGMMYVAFFGNGFLFVAGNGSLPAFMNEVSSAPQYSSIKVIDATHADDQTGAPFTATQIVPALEDTAPWGIQLNEDSGILYYVSTQFYLPSLTPSNVVKSYNINTNTQLPDSPPILLSPTVISGLKGFTVLPEGGGLICNGSVVNRLDAGGNIIQTYTPSIPLDSQILADIKLTADAESFWVVDLLSTRLYKFSVDTGTEMATAQPYGSPGTLVQMAIYHPGGPPIPTPQFGGIYKIVPGKRQDTLWTNIPERTTRDVKKPNPFAKLGPVGE